MDTTAHISIGRILQMMEDQADTLKILARQQQEIIGILREPKPQRDGLLRQAVRAFAKPLAAQAGKWLAGLPLWLLVLQGNGLEIVWSKLAAFFG